LDLAAHGEMSSTHTGNPLCCAAALANIAAIRDDGLLANAAALEPVARRALEALCEEFPDRVGAINGRGLVWGVYLLDETGREPDVELARRVVTSCMKQGLLMLQTGRGTLKVAPPLCIPEDALLEGIQVIEGALGECL
jgi:4-aminobutyrate aminotransferase/diaminobutyrate-pyruvate transaminase/4-aminobutyrate aminotransferase/(S)-3-amino-2-methylpropionate transaminase